jgi:hypothetical protein
MSKFYAAKKSNHKNRFNLHRIEMSELTFDEFTINNTSPYTNSRLINLNYVNTEQPYLRRTCLLTCHSRIFFFDEEKVCILDLFIVYLCFFFKCRETFFIPNRKKCHFQIK